MWCDTPLCKSYVDHVEDDAESNILIETNHEGSSSVLTIEEAEEAGIAYKVTFNQPCAVFCPGNHQDFDLLKYCRSQVINIVLENQKCDACRCYSLWQSGILVAKFGDWVIDGNKLIKDYALVLYDGKNKPIILYGLLHAVDATLDFMEHPPKTA